MRMVVVPGLLEVAAFSLAIAPFAKYQHELRTWTRDTPALTPIQHHANDTPCLALVPTWNEGLVIEQKLDNLSQQEGIDHLFLIDSASTDRTVEKALIWLEAHPTAFNTWNHVVLPQRKGKSFAIQHALDHKILTAWNGLVFMTDADALLNPGCVQSMKRWFHDPMIGAVGALPQRMDARPEEIHHRNVWDGLRRQESMIDSTPFLEGSAMMWRRELVSAEAIDETSNADDAQIACWIRIKHHRRVITDEHAQFRDRAPTTLQEQRRQKLRRGQGLQRTLARFSPMVSPQTHGKYSTVIQRQRQFHLYAPLLLLSAVVFSVLRWGFIFLSGWPPITTQAGMVHVGMMSGEMLGLSLWFFGRRGKRTGFFPLLTTWLVSMELLLISMSRIIRGIPSNMWVQHTETRMTMVDDEI